MIQTSFSFLMFIYWSRNFSWSSWWSFYVYLSDTSFYYSWVYPHVQIKLLSPAEQRSNFVPSLLHEIIKMNVSILSTFGIMQMWIPMELVLTRDPFAS